MPKILSFCAAVLLICAGALGALPASAGTPEEDVKAAYAQWDQAFNKGDASAVAAFYSNDAVFLPPTHEVVEGPVGVEKFFARFLAKARRVIGSS